MSCGAGLAASCPSCGTENPPGAKFCIECGTALGGTAAAPAPADDSAPPEERRTATIIFADLSGYTAVSERLDPERIKSLVDRTLRRLGEEIERYGGALSSAGAGAAAVPPSAVPHSMQNFAPGGFSVPHDGQDVASPAPHDMQNRARSGFSVPQLAQTTGPE